MFAPVAGVAAAPPVSGLVAAAARPDIQRWETGLAWIPERCGGRYRLVPICGDPSAGFTPEHPGSAYHRPVGVQWAEECTTLSGPPDMERMRRIAEAETPYVVARELWTGELAKTDPYTVGGVAHTNSHLASAAATTVGSSAASALTALGRLEAAALDASHGQAVMLHIPTTVAWQVADRLFRVGQQLLTAAGNVVVADGGYPGTGPTGQAAGATVWAYATGPVAVLLTGIRLVDGPSTVDRGTNRRTVWAEREFAVLFDPCLHLATEITL